MKHIVICADGTGNADIKGRGTNVFKLYEAVDRHGHLADPGLTPQVAIYHDGVGTENLKWLKVMSGATGWGLSRNVKELYRELVRVYDTGDKIFLFGFSRGAFTVRTLAGFIACCGILDINKPELRTNREFDAAVEHLYGLYRTRYMTWLQRGWRRLTHAPMVDFQGVRERHSIQHEQLAPEGVVPIEFIGVWDTVDAVGLPFQLSDLINTAVYRFKFPDTTLGPAVRRACQALALDEERQSFRPVLWNEDQSPQAPRIEQVWFAGVHSNIGGGYEKQGMSLVTLAWMIARAKTAGLRLLASDEDLLTSHRDVDDKLYDPRAGAGIFYRWQPRDVAALCARCGVRPKVHASAFERLARNTNGYACGTIPFDCDVEGMASPAGAAAVHGIIQPERLDLSSMLEEQRTTLRLGQLSYWLFTATVAVLALTGFYLYLYEAITRTKTWWRAALAIVRGLFSARWVTAVVRALWPHYALWGAALTALALTYVIELYVDRKMDDGFSEFWHQRHQRLRKALGL